MTRSFDAHAYGPGSPGGRSWPPSGLEAAAAPVGYVHVHEARPGSPHPGVTPVSSPHAPLYAADGAPFYNSGYVYPQHGPLLTGGFPSLRLPREAAMIDLTDTTTWDRPVWFLGAH